MGKKRQGQAVGMGRQGPRDQRTLVLEISVLIGRILGARIFERDSALSIAPMLEGLARLRVERATPKASGEVWPRELWPIPENPTEDWFKAAYKFYDRLREESDTETTTSKIIRSNVADEGGAALSQLESMLEYRRVVKAASHRAAGLHMFNAMRRLVAFEYLVGSVGPRLSGAEGGRPSKRESRHAKYCEFREGRPDASEKELAIAVAEWEGTSGSWEQVARSIREMKRRGKKR